jgi:hypothetical protein
MRISTILIYTILCFMLLVLITGCSHSPNQAFALWEERHMDDDRRIYGNPYEDLNEQSYLQFYVTY